MSKLCISKIFYSSFFLEIFSRCRFANVREFVNLKEINNYSDPNVAMERFIKITKLDIEQSTKITNKK